MSVQNPKLSSEELVKEWQDLVKQFDKELREKGLTEEQRERLLKELLEGNDKDE